MVPGSEEGSIRTSPKKAVSNVLMVPVDEIQNYSLPEGSDWMESGTINR